MKIPAFLFSMGLLCFFSTPLSAQTIEAQIKAFVHIQFDHGVPYQQAKSLPKEGVAILLTMLRSPEEQKWWLNIVTILGYAGDPQAVKPLIAFFESDTHGDVNLDTWSALINVYTALGHLAYAGDKKATDYLIESAEMQTWKTKKLRWTFQGEKGSALQNTFIRFAINGLGIAEQPKAMKELKRIETDPNTSVGMKQLAANALNLSAQIRKQGRDKVFGKGGH